MMTKIQMIALLIIVIALGILLSLFWMRGDPASQGADLSYREGEAAKTIAERQAAFNKALSGYLELEKTYQPRFGTGKLYYNIGNAYFQLSAYPFAILYYLKAQALMPRDEKVRYNLGLALDKLSLPKHPEPSAFAKVFFFHSYLSLPERLQLFFLLSAFALLLASINIWQKTSWIKAGLIAAGFLAATLLLSIAYTRYLTPVEGVLIRSADLRRDAGEHYARVGDEPAAAGTVVEVLGEGNEAGWFKVLTPKGELGYIPQEAIRLVGP
jgi:hypothetical protein